jgi:hypothetical protein
MDHCLIDDASMISEQLANRGYPPGTEVAGNGRGLGCARGICNGVILHVIVLFAGALCWCLYSLLR